MINTNIFKKYGFENVSDFNSIQVWSNDTIMIAVGLYKDDDLWSFWVWSDDGLISKENIKIYTPVIELERILLNSIRDFRDKLCIENTDTERIKSMNKYLNRI